jgi:periplasmic protein TonB
MFDAIGVSEATRKPWTVAVSLIGQTVVVGLAILVPLIGTDALPHRLSWVSVPEPPRALHHRAAQAVVKQASMVPSQITAKGLVLPARIPDKAVMLQDPEIMPSEGGAVVGGIEGANGPGNGVIDSVVRSMVGAAPPPPPPPVIREAPKPIPRITVGGRVQEGKLISGPRPVYPPLARQARVEGTVRLEAVISREGTIINLRAVSGHPLLIPSALAAVAQWVFRPTYLNDEPVEVATAIDVNFTLR